jgi:hypothetical protein
VPILAWQSDPSRPVLAQRGLNVRKKRAIQTAKIHRCGAAQCGNARPHVTGNTLTANTLKAGCGKHGVPKSGRSIAWRITTKQFLEITALGLG